MTSVDESIPSRDEEAVRTTQEAFEAALAAFSAANPQSAVIAIPEADREPGDPIGIVEKPWGDPSLAFIIPDDLPAVAKTLNSIVLPERLSAIWHSDSRDLEIIWTTRKLTEIWQPIFGRSFTFVFRGSEHICEFKESSDRLLTLARLVQPLSTSSTGFRNMQSFAAFVEDGGQEKESSYDVAKSFWISNFDWEAEKSLEIIRNLNFYLTYYDNQSPHVIIHDISQDEKELAQRTRYIASEFPKEIQAAEIDQNLLTFWGAAPVTNQIMQFIIYFRMIEYCSASYVDFTVRSEIQRIVSAPDIRSSLPNAVEAIISSVSKKSLDDPAKLKAVIRNNVDPSHIWADIAENLDFFSQPQEFDGGFRVRPLVAAAEAREGFCNRGLDQFTDTLRKIRNALSHGKDQETDGVILPTQRNMELLRPWVHLIATAAGDVALYKDVS